MKKKLNWKKIKLVLLDVDGVLTNGMITYHSDGTESKTYNVKDGRGIIEANLCGIEFGIITARESETVSRRAKDLNIKYLYQNSKNKVDALNDILNKTGFSTDEIMYIGDEVIDIPVMLKVGISATVKDCSKDVLKAADFISSKNGGTGAVREILEHLLKKQNKWNLHIKKYFNAKNAAGF
ncbi:MAG TPA: HAD-IIIA family hydrolase [bacterium]|nr:HAD-IIIA family hydrolase [bacterium]HPN29880.1 HAD-IIIA family hydrolase [bacterium]